LTKKKKADELYELLNLNYVEDADALFRFDYSKDFLQWYISAFLLFVESPRFTQATAGMTPGR
jgi:hypothetical protein